MHTDVSYENFRMQNYDGTKLVRRRKSSAQYKKEVAYANRRYKELCRSEGLYVNQWLIFSRKWIVARRRPQRVSRYTYTIVPYSVKEARQQCKQDRDAYTHDGVCSIGKQSKDARRAASKAVRNEWKRMRLKILHDDSYDRFYPHDKIGKPHLDYI